MATLLHEEIRRGNSVRVTNLLTCYFMIHLEPQAI
jgi:hypothetical protein